MKTFTVISFFWMLLNGGPDIVQSDRDTGSDNVITTMQDTTGMQEDCNDNQGEKL